MNLKKSSAIALLLLGCGPVGLGETGADDEVGEDTGATETAESAESAETGTDADASTDSESAGVIPGTTGEGPEPCAIFEQDCPEGEKCVPYASPEGAGVWDTSACVPVLGSGEVGDACVLEPMEQTDDCDASSWCWQGSCHAFCEGTPDTPTCPEDSYCEISAEASLLICLPTCDPVAQDCEAQGQGCYWEGAEFTCIPTIEEPVDNGQPCGFINDCTPGSFCINGENVPGCPEGAGPCCAPFCALDDPSACDALPGSGCVMWGEEPADFPNIGVCIVE